MNQFQTLRVEQLRDGHILVIGDYAGRYRVHRIRKRIHDFKPAVEILASSIENPLQALEHIVMPLGFEVTVAIL